MDNLQNILFFFLIYTIKIGLSQSVKIVNVGLQSRVYGIHDA